MVARVVTSIAIVGQRSCSGRGGRRWCWWATLLVSPATIGLFSCWPSFLPIRVPSIAIIRARGCPRWRRRPWCDNRRWRTDNWDWDWWRRWRSDDGHRRPEDWRWRWGSGCCRASNVVVEATPNFFAHFPASRCANRAIGWRRLRGRCCWRRGRWRWWSWRRGGRGWRRASHTVILATIVFLGRRPQSLVFAIERFWLPGGNHRGCWSWHRNGWQCGSVNLSRAQLWQKK